MNFATHVERAARNHPDAVAVSDERETVTFAQLARRTARVADALAARGVDVEDHVALHLPNGVPFVATYLGVLARGAIAVPVNRRFTAEQTEYVLADSDAVAVVTNARGKDVPAPDDGETYQYDALLDAGSPDGTAEPRRAEELAELLYTSGTTGAPKGVYHTHGNLDANAHGYVHVNRWARDDVALTVCQCFHVTGLNITTTPFLALEAHNHLLDHWDPDSALAAIDHHDVTYTFLIPTMAVELIDHDALDDHDLSSLQTIGVGGSPMPEKRIAEVEQALDCTLVEGYGMTETTPLATMNRPDDPDRKPGSVGRPVADAIDLRIEDVRTRDPVDQGERGELCWRGDTVTPRYNRDQLTANAFVERDGDRWLTSGDVGWTDADGYVHVVDRIDDMFTTGCGDVYPHEIESVIHQLDPVQQVAIVDAADDVRGTTITTIVSTRDDTTITPERIKTICERHLESHEIPDDVEFVDELPRTATGKLDRTRLRDRYG